MSLAMAVCSPLGPDCAAAKVGLSSVAVGVPHWISDQLIHAPTAPDPRSSPSHLADSQDHDKKATGNLDIPYNILQPLLNPIYITHWCATC